MHFKDNTLANKQLATKSIGNVHSQNSFSSTHFSLVYFEFYRICEEKNWQVPMGMVKNPWI